QQELKQQYQAITKKEDEKTTNNIYDRVMPGDRRTTTS
ncbi:unnamed protein product, partial [marine sediment metagenome]